MTGNLCISGSHWLSKVLKRSGLCNHLSCGGYGLEPGEHRLHQLSAAHQGGEKHQL